MSKSGEEFERRLDLAKYDLYFALKAIDEYLLAPWPCNLQLKKYAVELLDKALAKVEKPYKETPNED